VILNLIILSSITKVYNTAIYIKAVIILQLKHSIKEIIKKTGLNKSTISRIKKRAKEQGYTPKMNPIIIIVYIEDVPQFSRPKKITAKIKEKIIP
jgi:DNA-binding MarR family transcriptional regulator